jgi:hypothetical protein
MATLSRAEVDVWRLPVGARRTYFETSNRWLIQAEPGAAEKDKAICELAQACANGFLPEVLWPVVNGITYHKHNRIKIERDSSGRYNASLLEEYETKADGTIVRERQAFWDACCAAPSSGELYTEPEFEANYRAKVADAKLAERDKRTGYVAPKHDTPGETCNT